MFNLFKKKRIELPEFKELEESMFRNRYFIRIAMWDWMDSQTITVTDPQGPRVFTMDAWLQTIFLEATGQMTVTEFTHSMAKKYGSTSSIPDGLDRTILTELQKLVDLKVVALLNEPKVLAYYLELPQGEQNKEKAKQLMLSDGFIKE